MIHGTKNITIRTLHLLLLLKSGFLVLAFQLAGIAGYTQGQIIPLIKGTVKGSEGEFLAGASVSVQAAKIFATTKKDGTFELKNVPEGAVLRVSHVGHAIMEIKLKPGQTEVAIRLAVSANVMGEVVVNTGLYKRSAGSFTGASKNLYRRRAENGESQQYP